MAFLSVVIPTRNRPELLRQCLSHLEDQTLKPEAYEIVVVDDGSDPLPTDLPGSDSPARIRYLTQRPSGPAAARNRGVSAAVGEVVVLLGNDILAPPDFLRFHADWHREHTSYWDGLLGRVDWPACYLQDDYMRWLDSAGLQFGYAGLRAGQQVRYHHFYTSNLSLKRLILLEHPFDEEFTDATHEDTELGLRLEQAGFRLYFEPGCHADHRHFYTLEDSCRHRRRVGRGGFLFRRKHPDIARFKWIRRLPWPLRVVVASRPFRRIAAFAQSVGDSQPMSYYYYLRNSEAFWEGFREAAREAEISSNGPYTAPKPVTEKTATAVTYTEQGTVEPDNGAARPLISVVILSYNGGARLRGCLEQIFSQQIEAELDVILVDSGSTDGTETLGRDYPVRMIPIPPDQFRYGYARNLGFRAARGDYIATVSQDFVPSDRHWLDRLTRPLRSGADVVQGHAQPPPGARPFYWETRRFWFTSESRRFKERYGFCLSCVNLATRRRVWEDVGFGDDTPMSEDLYFQKHAFEKGYRRFAQAPEANGFHGHDYSLRSLFRRCQNEGLGWRWVGERYSFRAMIGDLLQPKSYAKWLLGLLTGRMRTPAELLFIWIRPLAVFKGNRAARRWTR